jgi:site-specific DNA-methyltransferase (adenine-specific)
MTALLRNTVLVGHARDQLARLADASVDMVLTSPPYYRLRNYSVPGQFGQEQTVDNWVDNLASVAAEVRRVLVPTGSFWLNLGDTYSTNASQGAPRKSLLVAPERLALRLVADGWCLRNKIVWQKANPMPTSLPDRLACTWEAFYVFTTQPRYFFDLDAIRVPHTSRQPARRHAAPPSRAREDWRGPNAGGSNGLATIKAQGRVGHPLGKNPGDVWRIASSNYRGPHRATFPVPLAERAILAGCPEARCARCRAPWRRAVIHAVGGTAVRGTPGPSCSCDAPREPGVVLDPFIGSGTTGVAAATLGRDWLGIDLNPAYAELARHRVHEARAGPRSA